nr:hypothetical protein CFP56_79723 [Quercus suber]
MTRNTRLTVSGFYSTKKKSAGTPSYSSMDFNKTCQDLSNPNEVKQVSGRSREEGNGLGSMIGHNQEDNAHLGINHVIKTKTKLMQSTNCGNKSAIIPQAVSDNHHEVVDLYSTTITILVTTQAIVAPDDKDFNTRLNETDAELAKFDSIKESNSTQTIPTHMLQ